MPYDNPPDKEICIKAKTYRIIQNQLSSFDEIFTDLFIKHFHGIALKELIRNLSEIKKFHANSENDFIALELQSKGILDSNIAKQYAWAILQSIDSSCADIINKENLNNYPNIDEKKYNQQIEALKQMIKTALILESLKHHKYFELNTQNKWEEKPVNWEYGVYKYLNFSLMFVASSITILGAFEAFPVLILGIVLLTISMLCHHLLNDRIEKNNKEQFDMKVMYNPSK